jgi:hypothetical protein
MKNADFVALVVANTNKTKNLRTYGEKWFSGARRVADRVLCKIGQVIALIQVRINEGKIINKDMECLLVYNIQPLLLAGASPSSIATAPDGNGDGIGKSQYSLYLTLDMIIKSFAEINNTHNLVGKPLQLVIEAVSGEVMSNTKAMLQLGIILPEDVGPEDHIESYGSFKDFNAVCGYVALASPTYLDPQVLFNGSLDYSQTVQNSVAFDSVVEASAYLKQLKETLPVVTAVVAELTLPKEFLPIILKGGLSKYVLKLIDEDSVMVTPHPEVNMMEARVDDELKYLYMSKCEPDNNPEEQVPHPVELLQ